MQLIGFPAQLALSAQSATTAVGAVLDNGIAKPSHALYVTAGAGVTAGVVTLEVSADNVNWAQPGASAVTVTTTAQGTQAVAVSFPAQYVRARISTAITGGTVTAYLASA